LNGILHIEFERFVKARLGGRGWPEVLRAARVEARLYVPRTDYPDAELLALLAALSAKTGESAAAIQEAFGEFIVPDLMALARSFVDPTWKTIDLIANTEATIHEVLRRAGTNTSPPLLKCEKTSPREVVVAYASTRKMCAFARGIANGVAKHYGERISIDEPACMLKGAAACELRVAVTD
jgi:predicted hydrocarbon binding protein